MKKPSAKVQRAAVALTGIDLQGVATEDIEKALAGIVGEIPAPVTTQYKNVLELADILRNPKRLSVLLSLKDGGAHRTGDIATKILEGSPIVSTTVGRMNRLGLVDTEEAQRYSAHSLTPAGVRLIEILDELEQLLGI
jgi:DNA-binding HxlR family transcriptional regulator